MGLDLFDLSGRIALVSGGNGGLGLAMAEALGEAGATVVLAARNAEKADAALARLAASGIDSSFVALDVSSTEGCGDAVAAVVRAHGRIDILVNNAGMSIRKLPEELTDDEWDEVLDVNLKSAFRCARAAFPAMRDQGGGKIINLGSMFSIFGGPKGAAYGASKGGITQLGRSLAVAWAPHNIQVNTILPGWLDTELTQAARQQVAGLEANVLARTPAGRWGRPDDVKGIAVFLASSASDFITGAAIPVDGGYSISV